MSNVLDTPDTIAPPNPPKHAPGNPHALSPQALRRVEDEAYTLHAVEMLSVRTIAQRQGVDHSTVVRRVRRAAERYAARHDATITQEKHKQAHRYEAALASAWEDYQQQRTVGRLKAVLLVLSKIDRLHALDRSPPGDHHTTTVLSAHTTIASSPQPDPAKVCALLGEHRAPPLPQPLAPPQPCDEPADSLIPPPLVDE